jgi:hypothetical protein
MSVNMYQATLALNNASDVLERALRASSDTKSLDQPTIYQILHGLQLQSIGLFYLASAVDEMDDKLDAIKQKLGIR